jgi:hypothetical protein
MAPGAGVPLPCMRSGEGGAPGQRATRWILCLKITTMLIRICTMTAAVLTSTRAVMGSDWSVHFIAPERRTRIGRWLLLDGHDEVHAILPGVTSRSDALEEHENHLQCRSAFGGSVHRIGVRILDLWTIDDANGPAADSVMIGLGTKASIGSTKVVVWKIGSTM